ncbi:metallophosphoesterase family protein [Cohnella algarum]|uniref:metallophosphoesterase family protein n=1 Tax=Cohnella algarum TaxID=2044859 RepID=UPI001966FFB3|nr:metallophosphoesterase [Cohnella algarum]MBN2984125.1 metallophosphoesterase [Cohnella algarum]
MKIVIVADTHMPRMAKKLPEPLERELKRADAILHAGDWTDPKLIGELGAFAPVYGVAGNNDGPDIVKRLGYRKIVRFGPVALGLVHGHGPGARTDTETNALNAFKGEDVQAVVYGHSHIPVLKEKNGLLVFNPGSPTDKRRQPAYSFGVMEIEGGRLRARHVFYERKRSE